MHVAIRPMLCSSMDMDPPVNRACADWNFRPLLLAISVSEPLTLPLKFVSLPLVQDALRRLVVVNFSFTNATGANELCELRVASPVRRFTARIRSH